MAEEKLGVVSREILGGVEVAPEQGQARPGRGGGPRPGRESRGGAGRAGPDAE